MRKRKKLFLCSLVLCSAFLSSCAFKDIDKRLFVAAIGVDPSEEVKDGYKITLKVALPFGAIKQEKEPLFSYLTIDAKTVGEGLRLLDTHVDKVLDLGQLKAIIIHEELLTNHMKTFMDYFVRRGDIQMIAYVAGARPSAEAIVKMEPDTEAPASVSLYNFFGGTGTESPYIITNYLFQLRREFFSKGLNPILPLIEVDEEAKEFIINKSLVISEDKKPLELTPPETKYLNSLVNHKVGLSYHIITDDLRLLLNIERAKMKFKIIKKGRTPTAIQVNVKLSGVIGESSQFLSLKHLDKYNKISEKRIKKTVNELLHKLQEENVDPFGFGLRYHAITPHYEGISDEWAAAYPNLDIQLNVDVKLQSTGLTE